MVAAVAGWLLRPTQTHSAAHHWLRVDPGARTEQFMQMMMARKVTRQDTRAMQIQRPQPAEVLARTWKMYLVPGFSPDIRALVRRKVLEGVQCRI
ncbi:hypothetical protein EYF80_010221 [Liparis tanakae]|uniref:Uncharacterized protein n=1 Tax=Liparis tanakae TaxID=230148 RepID=A0A4Z2INN2_9TELE|nr:hypothetical protein EYF80_010221 [Liparis tanakae]